MPTYVALMKLTDQGAKDIKNAPQRARDLIKGLEAMGGKVISIYLTMGEYDYIGIAEAPSDEVALTFLAGMGAVGNVRSTTLKAFTLEELGRVVAKLP